jgi:hypothetical protein
MEINFNYDHELVDRYLQLLTSPDLSIRSTAIVDMILHGIYKEYPFEFYTIMQQFDQVSFVPDVKSNEQYNALVRALHSYQSISGMYIREELDLIIESIYPNGVRASNQIDSLIGSVETLRYKVRDLEYKAEALNTALSESRTREDGYIQMINRLQFRVDNGQYDDTRTIRTDTGSF